MMNQYFELHPLILGPFFLGWAPYLYHEVYRRHTICMAFVKSYKQCILLRTLVAQRALWSFPKDVMLFFAWSSCSHWQNSHWLQIGWLGHCWRPLEKPESEWICHPILILACFDGNFLWSKSKPVHSLLGPSFYFGSFTKNIPILTPAHEPASVSIKGSGSPSSGTAITAASDPNLT